MLNALFKKLRTKGDMEKLLIMDKVGGVIIYINLKVKICEFCGAPQEGLLFMSINRSKYLFARSNSLAKGHVNRNFSKGVDSRMP